MVEDIVQRKGDCEYRTPFGGTFISIKSLDERMFVYPSQKKVGIGCVLAKLLICRVFKSFRNKFRGFVSESIDIYKL